MDTGNKSRPTVEGAPATNFIKDIIDADLRTNKHAGKVATRFPPEPNGYLHIGHAKSICLNFGIAEEYAGATCNLRFDDTNPAKEDEEYVESIQEDVRWLGFDWGDRLFFASDYFDQMYQYALQLIREGKAYVDSLSPEETKAYRGDFHTPGRESPYRNRSVEENLALFERMRKGEFEEGAQVLRAKIDMASPNMNMRDPAIYRIKHARHHRTGDRWCIYPMYDFAHCIEDSIEGITHSICTLEFEDNRPLYDWVLDTLRAPCHPQQIEFARLNLSHTVMSKRLLQELIRERVVSGWDDPRMPTVSGLRRRGYTPSAIRAFCERVGVAKKNSTVDMALLEHAIRDELNRTCPRVMVVQKPLKVVIENYPEGETLEFDAPYHPEDPALGSRKLPFSKVLYIEQDDFREDPPPKWFRLAPGREIRLRYACLIKCVEAVKDAETGDLMELRCTWDPASLGGNAPDGRKVRGTSHWVSAAHAIPCEVRLYDRLFQAANPIDPDNPRAYLGQINPYSLSLLTGCMAEPSLANPAPGARFQFERLGYYNADPVDCSATRIVFNRTVSLKDSWARIEEAQKSAKPEAPKPAPASGGGGRPGPKPIGETIGIEAFQKLDLRVGVVREAALVEGADKLIRLMVDIGEAKPRQIFAGIRSAYPEPDRIVGQRVAVLANLPPRKMRFGVSEGMILAAGEGNRLGVATFLDDLRPGDKIQ